MDKSKSPQAVKEDKDDFEYPEPLDQYRRLLASVGIKPSVKTLSGAAFVFGVVFCTLYFVSIRQAPISNLDSFFALAIVIAALSTFFLLVAAVIFILPGEIWAQTISQPVLLGISEEIKKKIQERNEKTNKGGGAGVSTETDVSGALPEKPKNPLERFVSENEAYLEAVTRLFLIPMTITLIAVGLSAQALIYLDIDTNYLTAGSLAGFLAPSAYFGIFYRKHWWALTSSTYLAGTGLFSTLILTLFWSFSSAVGEREFLQTWMIVLFGCLFFWSYRIVSRGTSLRAWSFPTTLVGVLLFLVVMNPSNIYRGPRAAMEWLGVGNYETQVVVSDSWHEKAMKLTNFPSETSFKAVVLLDLGSTLYVEVGEQRVTIPHSEIVTTSRPIP